MSKYSKKIKDVEIDVYDILHAYNVTNPATQHAIKKLLMAGLRGHKTETQDMQEAEQSIKRALEIMQRDYVESFAVAEEEEQLYENLCIGAEWRG